MIAAACFSGSAKAMRVKFKKLAGGGYLKIVNRSVEAALVNLGYKESEIQDIKRYITGHGDLSPKLLARLHIVLSQDEIDQLRSRVKDAFDLAIAFHPDNLGNLKEKILPSDQEFKTGDEVLRYLVGKEGLEDAKEYCNGTMTIEGAPHILQRHIPIFDCANTCGPKGQRFLSPISHIKIMAAAQPFISGAISKTINMPKSSTVDDISDIYWQSHKMGLKAVAIYRDGSKLSQPLNLALNIDYDDEEPLEDKSVHDKIVQIVQEVVPKVVDPRRRLPSRRRGYTQKASIDGHKLYIRTGEYEDGTLGEVFLDIHKEGATLRSLMNSLAVAISIGIQYGVPLEEYVDSFVGTKFEPAGLVNGHDNIKMSSSLLDYVFRDLAIQYLGRTDLANVKPIPNLKMVASSENVELAQIAVPLAKETRMPTNSRPKLSGQMCSSCQGFNLV
jgi:ribonucleoside-diphosphate reductase alpha chain